jgi:hypothetical protein
MIPNTFPHHATTLSHRNGVATLRKIKGGGGRRVALQQSTMLERAGAQPPRR